MPIDFSYKLSTMEIISTISAAFIVVCVVYNALISMWKPKNFPPGPVGLPFVGSFHYLLPSICQNMTRLSKTYGNIFSLKLKDRNIVCILGYELIKEVMVDNPKPFSNRLGNLSSKLLRGTNLEGIATTQYGPKWAAHRKLFLTAVRKMALRGKSTDKIVKDELRYFVDEMEKDKKPDQTIDPSDIFDYAVLNVLANLVFGNRFSYGDEKFKKLLHLNSKFFHLVKKETLSYLVVASIPYLHKLWLPDAKRQVIKCNEEIKDFVASEIDYHKKTLDRNEPRDVIDYYLIEMENQSNNLLSDIGLHYMVMDLFQAGTETTSTTLKWTVLYMANNLEVQEKVHAEIDSVLDQSAFPCSEDSLKMPYTQAAILESQRMGDINPIGVPHATTEDVKLGGYDLPKGTCVITLYSSIRSSSKQWKNADNFDPENFLDPNGQVGTRPACMPYGGGLRICVGKDLAKQELFLFFVTMMKHYQILPPPGVSKLDDEHVTRHPKPFHVVMKSRF